MGAKAIIDRVYEVWDCTYRYCPSLARGVTFLSPNKKVTKEVGLGETLTVIAYRYCISFVTCYPGFKPLSPKTPSRPLSLPGR